MSRSPEAFISAIDNQSLPSIPQVLDNAYQIIGEPASPLKLDKIMDAMLKGVGVDMDAYNEYCEKHPRLMRALASNTSRMRPVLGGAAFAALAYGDYTDNPDYTKIALATFLTAAVGDAFDGYWARKGKVASEKGAQEDMWGDALLRIEELAALVVVGDNIDRALFVPRVWYEVGLLRIRNQDQKEEGFKSSSLGKTKIIADGITGGALIAEKLAEDRKTKRVYWGIRKASEVAAIGLVRADVKKRKIRRLVK